MENTKSDPSLLWGVCLFGYYSLSEALQFSIFQCVSELRVFDQLMDYFMSPTVIFISEYGIIQWSGKDFEVGQIWI